jgi:hypothetical protein
LPREACPWTASSDAKYAATFARPPTVNLVSNVLMVSRTMLSFSA